MRKTVFLLLLIFVVSATFAADSVRVKQTRIPVLIDRVDNVLFYLRIDAKESKALNEVKLLFADDVNLNEIEAVKLYYGGTDGFQREGKVFYAPVQYISSHTPGKTKAANPSYSILVDEQKSVKREVVFSTDYKLFPDINYFWISLQMKPDASLLSKIDVKLVSVGLDNEKAPLEFAGEAASHRLGIGVRHAGDDNSASFRIPGLVTSNAGTLLGVYDVRYNTSVDLQEYVDVGLSRSTDKGQTWEKMRLPLAFGEYGGLPKAQNGVGDPAILVDNVTGDIWVIAAWTHGLGNMRAWTNSKAGMEPDDQTAQLVLAKSTDDGKTWSDPINITKQVKDPSWKFLLQGPGMGITMQDGTLVFPIQFIDSTRTPNAGIMYSKDRGKNWKIENLARTNTTEAQVAEVEPGVLMLNMRDNRGGSRAVFTTKDLGKTWQEHPSNRSVLREPVCMASLIKIEAKDNALGKDILLFSNPNTTEGRHHITIKASLDGGLSFPEEYQVMLDEDHGWGYTCLTRIDSETIGILYESSVAHMTFQAVKLSDLIK